MGAGGNSGAGGATGSGGLGGATGGHSGRDGGVSDAGPPGMDAAPRPATLAIGPGSADLSVVVIGQHADATFEISNAGDEATAVPGVSLSGTDAAQFSLASNGCTAAIAGGKDCLITVRFAPTTAGAKTASLVVAASAGGTVTATLQGSGVSPGAITITPNNQAFDPILAGMSGSPHVFTVTNTGGAATGALATTLNAASGFTIASDGCSGLVLGASGGSSASCMIGVTFAPASVGPMSGTLAVTGAPGGTASASLTGTGLAPATLSISPTGFGFAGTVVGATSASQSFTVTNGGGVAAGSGTAMAVALGGANGASFSVSSSTCSGTLGSGASCTVSVVFKPTASGSEAGTLTATAAPGGSASASLTASGLTPGSISIAPTSFAFADTLVGATSASHSFAVTNGGGAPIGTGTALSVVLSGPNAKDFSISSTTCTATLAAAASCTVALVFKPTAAGARTAGMTVNAAPGGNASASLSGTGLSQAGLTLAVASGSSINFGTVATSSSATETFTVTNTGQGASSAILVSLSGADYALVAPAGGDCVNAATILAGGLTCTIRVRFIPSTTGTRTGSLSASAATGGTPPALSLTGIGKLPTGTIFEYPTLPNGTPTGNLAVGADGAIYFGGSAMGRMTLAGAFSVLGNASDGVWFVVAAPDSNLWYTNFSASTSSAVVGQMSIMGTTNEFTFTGGRQAENIAVGPDDNIWVSEPNSNLVLRVSTSGALLNQYTVPYAYALAAGPDGNVWVVELLDSKIARIVIASGAVTEYPVDDLPDSICAGPDGNLWVLENSANKIGKFSTASLTLLAEYPASANANLNSITSGPDGNLWFTEPGISKVGRITRDGAIMEYATPTAGSGPLAITAGPDGNVYFVESTAHRIARISP